MKPSILPTQVRFGFILLTLSLLLNALISYDNLRRILSRSSPSGGVLSLEGLSVFLGVLISLGVLLMLYRWASQQFRQRHAIEQSLKSRQNELSQHIERCTYELEDRLQSQQALSQAIAIERQRLKQLKDEFIVLIEHELKTPMTSIHGSLQMLNSGLIDTRSERGQRLLTIATDSADHLTTLINQIVELENHASGLVNHLVACNLGDLLQESVELQRGFAIDRGIQLVLTSIPDRKLQVLADQQRLQQVIHHLIRNAIQFSPRGSVVRVEAQPKADQVLFTIQDQGHGIAPEQLEMIFDRFYQIDHSIARKHDGPGIGLAVCRRIVEVMQGQIWVESQLGVGSTFYFTLPRC